MVEYPSRRRAPLREKTAHLEAAKWRSVWDSRLLVNDYSIKPVRDLTMHSGLPAGLGYVTAREHVQSRSSPFYNRSLAELSHGEVPG